MLAVLSRPHGIKNLIITFARFQLLRLSTAVASGTLVVIKFSFDAEGRMLDLDYWI